MEDNVHAENLKTELSGLNTELGNIVQRISDVKHELNVACKHINCIEEYDDDFCKPGFYNRCLTCDREFKKKLY